jgi:hypothetical protein
MTKQSNSTPNVTDEMAFWRAYLEILNERVPLVDHWRDGSITWHPRVGKKLLWYSGLPITPDNMKMAYAWLMQNAASPLSSNELKTSRRP